MNTAGRIAVCLLVIASVGGALGETAHGQVTVPATMATPPAATAPASNATSPATAATTKPKRPAVSELLSRKTVTFNFVAAPVGTVLEFMGKSFNLTVENAFELPDLLTVTRSLNARDAIDTINLSLQPTGYTLLATVRDDDGKPRVVLTMTQIKKDAGRIVDVHRGSDPASIPEGVEVRTQIMTFTNVDLEKYRDMITAALSNDASININAETKTLIITDTGTHIRTLASILQVLEKQAGGGK